MAEHHYLLRQPDTALYVNRITPRESSLDFANILYHRQYLDLALGIFAPRANLKPERARALYKRSLILEALDQLDESNLDRKESLRLYYEVVAGTKRRLQTLVEEDFDSIVAFWSR